MKNEKEILKNGIERTESTGVFRLSESQGFLGGRKVFIEFPKTASSPYIVDDSQFTPLSEALKQLDNASPISEDKLKSYYDFADGSDTGISIPIGRNPQNMSDIAEISTAISERVQKIADNAKDLNDKVARAQRDIEFTNSLKANSAPTSEK